MSGAQESQTLDDALNVNPIISIEKRKSKILYGYCQCGCGQKTTIAKQSDSRCGWINGMPKDFVKGHNSKKQPKGENAYNWKGGKLKQPDGRILVLKTDHSQSRKGRYVFRSRLLAESALGKPLPSNAVVHHSDENPGNDEKNLILCENEAYHRLLHQRKRAFDSCGNVNSRKCNICKTYDDLLNLYVSPGGGTIYHKDCYNKKRRMTRGNRNG